MRPRGVILAPFSGMVSRGSLKKHLFELLMREGVRRVATVVVMMDMGPDQNHMGEKGRKAEYCKA